MATTTTQRHQHGGPTALAPSLSAANNSGGGVRPPDPRLELSLRAFRQILPKKRPRQASQSGEVLAAAVAEAAAAAAARTCMPAPPPPFTTPLSPAAARYFSSSPATATMATATAATPTSTPYNPASPWGVLGIGYDPASPRGPLQHGVTSASTPVPEPASAPKPTCEPHSFVVGRLPIHVPPVAAVSPLLPHGGQQQLPPPPPWKTGKSPFFGPGLREVLSCIPTAAPAPPSHHPRYFKEDPYSVKKGLYITDKRFVLANGLVEEGLAQETTNGASSHNPPLVTATATAVATAPVTTTNENSSHKPPTKIQLVNIQPVAATATNGTPTPDRRPPRCCPMEVPSILHMILDRTSDKLDPRMVEHYSGHFNSLCADHLAKYLRLKASIPQQSSPLPICPETPTSTPTPTPNPGMPETLRTASTLPPPLKKRRVSGNVSHHRPQPRLPHIVGRYDIRPVANVVRDSTYRKQILEEIQQRFATLQGFEATHGGVTNRVIHNLLTVAKQPNAYADKGPVDVHFLTGDEARAMLDAGSPNEPVVTEKEQMFRWQPRLRPIAELFRRMENLERRVSVQVPSRGCMDDSFESHDLTQVRDRFLANEATDDPWNILDLRSPLPAAVLPQFLTNENCQLLPRLRDEVLNPSRAERDTAAREQWNEWRDVLEWVLLSQGGHNTSPHTDSHGLGTWITVQEGLFGFGWLSHPTAEERAAWMANPHGFTGGNWCYLVLEPGQTVFFNSGTVHFVFRLRTEHTLALGGHVLQWSGIERWLQVVAAQMQNPHITNEDMEWSAPRYVRVVARLVAMRLQNQRVEEMGGEAAVRRLLGLLKEFDETYIKERPKTKSKKKKQR